MSNPSEPPFLSDIRDRLRRYRDAVVCAVTARTKADYSTVRRLLDSDEVFPYVTEGLSDLMRQFVADCRSHSVREDMATEAAGAVQECTRRLRGILAQFPTVHTQEGRTTLLELWHRGYDDPPKDDELYWFSMGRNHSGEGGQETVQDAADYTVRPAAELLDSIKNTASTATAERNSDTNVLPSTIPKGPVSPAVALEGLSFVSDTRIEYGTAAEELTQSQSLILRGILTLRAGRDIPVAEKEVIRSARLETDSTRTHLIGVRAALKALRYPKRLRQQKSKASGVVYLHLDALNP